MKNFKKGILTGLCAIVGVATLGAAAFTLATPTDVETAYAETTYTTKDIAMMGRVAGWHGNGNFEIRLTLGESDWTEEAEKVYAGTGDLPGLLKSMDFFNHIKIGEKTLAEWGCTTCYSNTYWLNASEPDYTIQIPLSMGAANMATASAAGVGGGSLLTILEGALIPSNAYLQGDTTATVYRAGCDFVTTASEVAYGIMAVGKTEVESLQYVTGWDATYNNAYLGVSLKGDDYVGNGAQTERDPNYGSSVFMTNHFSNKITADGVGGKSEQYGLFNLGSKGQGYFSFVFRAMEEETEEIFIPAGTLFPSFAMSTLRTVNGNPVYMMYETQTDITFYKQADGTWQKPLEEKETSISSVKVQVGSAETDTFTVFSLSNHDYPGTIDNYGGTAVGSKAFLANTNFYTHILINGVEIGSTNEAYLNVWGNKGAIGIRTSAGLSATEITILAGCQIPTYAALENGAREAYVTKEDITFVKNSEGVFVEKSAYVGGYLEAAKVELDSYKAGLFRETEEAERAEIVATAKANINETLSEEEVKNVVAEAKTAIDALKTAAQYADEELAAVKSAAVAEIEGYKADVDYFEEQIAERVAAVNVGKAAIANAVTEDAIATAVTEAKAAIDAIVTKAMVVEGAKAALDAYKAEEGYFNEKEVAERAAIIATAKVDIDNATTQAAVNEVVANAKAAIDMLLAASEYYTAKDVAMLGRVAGWHGNGNFEIRITLGECDWTANDAGNKTYDGELKTLLTKLNFFNSIKLGDKTLAEWGCTACYDNIYWLGNGGPQHTLMIPLSMGKDNMTEASAAGIHADSPITILEGALIPGYGYLTKTGDTVYRAGCDYVSVVSTKAYGIEATAKTEVESLAYVQGHDGTCGYLGISFVGDDYLGDGTKLAVNQNYYFDNKFSDLILVNGEAGKVGYYGLFNLNENGMGYYAFQIFATAEELVSITIPAGAKFPTRAMTTLFTVNENPVYIMYEVAEEITLYKTENGFVTYAEYVLADLEGYKAGLFREAEEAQRLAIIADAKAVIATAADNAAIDLAVAEAKAAIDALKTAAQYADEELKADKLAAVATVEGYNAEVEYLEEQATLKAEAIETAKTAIAEATTAEEITAAVEEAKAAIDALTAKAAIVSAALAEVEGYNVDVEYLEEGAAEKAAIIATATAAIEGATTEAAINEAVATAKAAIDAIKTKAEIETEILNAKKEEANIKVNDLKKAIDFDLYEEDAIATINGLYSTVKAAITAATTEEEINAAVASFETALAEVPQKDIGGEDNSGETSDITSEEESSDEETLKDQLMGCFSGVNAITYGVIALGLGVMKLLKKKED